MVHHQLKFSKCTGTKFMCKYAVHILMYSTEYDDDDENNNNHNMASSFALMKICLFHFMLQPYNRHRVILLSSWLLMQCQVIQRVVLLSTR